MFKICYGTNVGDNTNRIHELLKGAASSGKRALIVVPEQFHFETEKLLYRLLGERLFSEITVTSFTKLSAAIIRKHGTGREYADDVIKLTVMYRAVNELRGVLRYYGAQADKSGFPKKLLGMVSRLKGSGISALELCDALEKGALSADAPSGLDAKLSDIAEIYSLYDAELRKSFDDRLDDLAYSARLAEEAGYFRGIEVFIDSFDGFTGAQLKLLTVIAAQSASLTVSLLCDNPLAPSPDYAYTGATARLLRELAEKNGSEPELAKSVATSRPLNAKPVIAPDIFTECNYVCAEISRLVREEGYRYREIAVLFRAPRYSLPLADAFARYEITAFPDIPEPVTEKPLARFFLTALDAAAMDKSDPQRAARIMELITGGFVRVSSTAAEVVGKERLEELRRNLPAEEDIAAALKNRRKCRVQHKNRTVRLDARSVDGFLRLSSQLGMKSADWERELPERAPDRARLEPVRKELIGALDSLHDKLTDTTGDAITSALCSFVIRDMQIQRTVFSLCNRRGNGFKEGFTIDRELNDEYRALWEILMRVFESLHTGLRGVKIAPQDYLSLLTEVLSGTSVAKPPQVVDAVTVGDTERTRLHGARAVFVMGAVQGELPCLTLSDETFTSREIEALCGGGINISDDRLTRYRHERFIVKKALNLPRELIVLTASLLGAQWESLTPSPEVGALAKAYGVAVVNAASLPTEFYAVTRGSAEQLAAERYPACHALTDALKATGDGAFIERLAAASEREYGKAYLHAITPQSAEKLFANVTFSPTAVEKLCSCRYRYFCEAGLRISEPQEDGLTKQLLGTIIHKGFEEIMGAYCGKIEQFCALTDAELTQKADECLESFRKEKLLGSFGKSRRTEYIYGRLNRDIVTLLKGFRREFESSGFKPIEFEKRVSGKIGEMPLAGQLDRLDAYETEGRRFMRIADYKTGGKDMDLYMTVYGINLQMLLYLFAICDEEGGYPSGVSYFPATAEKFSDGAGAADKDVARLRGWYSTHKPQGVKLCADYYYPQRLKAVHDAIKAGKKLYKAREKAKDKGVLLPKQSTSFPAAVIRADEFSTRSLEDELRSLTGTNGRSTFLSLGRLSLRQYYRLKAHCAQLLTDKRNELLSGDVAALPLEPSGKHDSCKYCPIAGYCLNAGKREVIPVDKEEINRVIGLPQPPRLAPSHEKLRRLMRRGKLRVRETEF